MNINHDEFGPVDMDELTAIHHEKIQRRFEMENKKREDEPTKNKASKMPKSAGSQECVGNHGKRYMSERANKGAAHKNLIQIRTPRDLKRYESGRAPKLTYAQVVTE